MWIDAAPAKFPPHHALLQTFCTLCTLIVVPRYRLCSRPMFLYHRLCHWPEQHQQFHYCDDYKCQFAITYRWIDIRQIKFAVLFNQALSTIFICICSICRPRIIPSSVFVEMSSFFHEKNAQIQWKTFKKASSSVMIMDGNSNKIQYIFNGKRTDSSNKNVNKSQTISIQCLITTVKWHKVLLLLLRRFVCDFVLERNQRILASVRLYHWIRFQILLSVHYHDEVQDDWKVIQKFTCVIESMRKFVAKSCYTKSIIQRSVWRIIYQFLCWNLSLQNKCSYLLNA